VDRCADNPGRAMAFAADVLVVGEIYEVMRVNERSFKNCT
jgi:hypothetical protein